MVHLWDVAKNAHAVSAFCGYNFPSHAACALLATFHKCAIFKSLVILSVGTLRAQVLAMPCWRGLKAGFHYRRSRNRSRTRSRSHKGAYALVKIEYRSRKRSHKLDRIGVGRIRTFPFLPIPFTTPSLMIQWKLGVGVGSRSGRPNQSQGPESNIVIGLFFCFCLRLRQCSFHLIVSDGVISKLSVLLPTPSVWFSVDRIALCFWLRLRLRLRR